jgi:hypothetical protein
MYPASHGIILEEYKNQKVLHEVRSNRTVRIIGKQVKILHELVTVSG